MKPTNSGRKSKKNLIFFFKIKKNFIFGAKIQIRAKIGQKPLKLPTKLLSNWSKLYRQMLIFSAKIQMKIVLKNRIWNFLGTKMGNFLPL